MKNKIGIIFSLEDILNGNTKELLISTLKRFSSAAGALRT